MTKPYVGGQPYSMTDENLQLLTGKGYQPVSAKIVTELETGRSRCLGFFELGQGDAAGEAIGELNGLNVEGRALHVNEGRPQESGVVVVVRAGDEDSRAGVWADADATG